MDLRNLFWLCIAFSVILAVVTARAAYFIGQEFIPEESESGSAEDDRDNRGLLDLLENFRLWRIERRRVSPPPSTLPTPEPTGFDLLLPRIPDIRLDEDAVKRLIAAWEDFGKSFVGPPSTEPPVTMDYNGTNISTTIPPNHFFCLFC